MFHAYKFTHFSSDAVTLKPHLETLSKTEKLRALLFGVSIPRPRDYRTPTLPYKTIRVNDSIECWQVTQPHALGTVILFHGYCGNKSNQILKSEELMNMGYNTVLVDFRGSGGSEGNTTTIGFNEAKDVKACYDYFKKQEPHKLILLGTSMGAAAIMKCVHDDAIKADALILECPFGTMREAVESRFRLMHAPAFPMADLLLFYGGLMNGFWAFNHNPQDYAKDIQIPTLLLAGGKDERVLATETDVIFKNLAGSKTLKVYPNAQHESYLNEYRDEWVSDVSNFLKK